MKAKLLYRQKETDAGFIRELVIWKLDQPAKGCRHLFKYRLFLGRTNGTCLVRYDNEQGKGDHKHLGNLEEPYRFSGIEALLVDFAADVAATMAAEEKEP